MTFIRRHFVATLLCLVALALTFCSSWLFSGFQIGIGPEFIVKAFAKLLYLGFAFICTHIVVKYMFPTIYAYCYTKGDTHKSEFQIAWADYRVGSPVNNFDSRLYIAVNTHIGIFLGVCLLLALAF